MMKQVIDQKIKQDLINISEYEVKFKLKVLLKMFFYHLLWFAFGFLCVPVITLIDSFALAKNMSFWLTTTNKVSLYIQIFQWLFLVVLHVLYILKYFEVERVELKNVFFEQLLFLDIQMLIRSFIIAVRYSYASNLRLHLITHKTQN
mmetsp:Transcript_2167/g.2086  ORF Transcript_2167/g.2086 Transcript_2167/m.2086 type:complete len:147 (-) Transcript_2167:1321-1761(-)